MDTYGKRLEAALDALNRVDRDRAWLAGKVGFSVSALSQVILGKTKALTAENHECALEALGCNGKWLATGVGEMYGPNQSAALVDTAQTAIKEVAPDILALIKLVNAIPLDARKDALMDAASVLIGYLVPASETPTQEPAPAATQANTPAERQR